MGGNEQHRNTKTAAMEKLGRLEQHATTLLGLVAEVKQALPPAVE
jgi:hypothetical protein